MTDLYSICLWLVKQCRVTGATELKETLTNVSEHGENIGDWEIIVRKLSHPDSEGADE